MEELTICEKTKSFYENSSETLLSCQHRTSLSIYLLKFATMMGMGRVMQSTPQMAHSDPTNFPAAVRGATSP